MRHKFFVSFNDFGFLKSIETYLPSPSRRTIAQLVVGLLCLCSLATVAQQLPNNTDTEELRRRQRSEAEERRQRQNQPHVQSQQVVMPESSTELVLPNEKNCFWISGVALNSLANSSLVSQQNVLSNFDWIQSELYRYVGKCIGSEGINLIVKRITAQLLEKGYTTTRIGIPEQDLSGGVLSLTLIPGVISNIKVTDANNHWKTALPMRTGDVLNIRDMEQGLENFKRLPSNQVDIQIAPGQTPGESDVLVDLKQERPWRISVTVDDAGSKSTGKRQVSNSFLIDNPFQLNDQLNLSLNHDAQHEQDTRGTRGLGFGYSIPWGYWMFSLNGGTNKYHQQIAGSSQVFTSSGESKSIDLKAQRVIYRDQTIKTSVGLRLGKRWSNSYIDDTEILVQKKNTTQIELALNHKQYVGDAQWDLMLAHRRGVPWLGGQKDDSTMVNGSSYEYGINLLDLNLNWPFKIAGTALKYSGSLRAQQSKNRLFSSEYFSIGNRYTVRGYDGETTLAAESGALIKNEIEVPLGESRQSIYMGLDFGKVSGDNTANLVGTSLSGTALGLRGGWNGISYDVFISWALHKPAGFTTVKPVTGFQLNYQY